MTLPLPMLPLPRVRLPLSFLQSLVHHISWHYDQPSKPQAWQRGHTVIPVPSPVLMVVW